jgi:phospholipase C
MSGLWLRLAVAVLVCTANGNDASRIDELKEAESKLTLEQVHARFGQGPRISKPRRRKHKIDHFVVLLMENHAADHMFGCMNLSGFDVSPGHALPNDPSDPSKGVFNITCATGADYVCNGLSNYDTFAGKFGGNGSNPNRYPYSAQHDNNSVLHGATPNATSVKMFSAHQLPIKTALARQFGVFNKLYTAVPAASNPNHLFIQSATSCGLTSNGLYDDCGGKTITFPQRTIYDSMREHNISFGFYMNTTCGLDGHECTGPQHPQFSIPAPDVAMQGVARYKEYYFSQELFYEQAANGTLPHFVWINPPVQASDHPCQDVAKGERLLKDIYESLRASPQWNKTLLFVAYDDGGGYYDHVVPPFEGVPADDSPCHVPGPHNATCGHAFDFRRLGLRAGAMLISPLVDGGVVFQEPRGPTPTSQFELTSVPATIKNLFNLTSFLTKRDSW